MRLSGNLRHLSIRRVIRKGTNPVSSFRWVCQKLSAALRGKWIWIGLAALPALRFYYVREMIAALMIFSVLFVAVAFVVLVIFLIDRFSQQIVVWAEPGAARVARWVADVPWIGDARDAIVATPAWVQALPHRFRKELKENEKI
jgi:hypothetical protein